MSDPHDWGRGDTRRLKTSQIPAAVLALVEARDGGRRCAECRHLKVRTPESEPLEIDHRQPLAKGGTNHWTNLQWLCRGHNRAKRDGLRPLDAPWLARARADAFARGERGLIPESLRE